MTRKDILKKYGYSWMSNVDLREELSEQEAAEFEGLIRTLAEHNRGPALPETGWKKRMYNQFMKEQADDTKHDHRDMANSIPTSCDFSVCFTHSKGDRKMVGQEDGTVTRRVAPEDRRKI